MKHKALISLPVLALVLVAAFVLFGGGNGGSSGQLGNTNLKSVANSDDDPCSWVTNTFDGKPFILDEGYEHNTVANMLTATEGCLDTSYGHLTVTFHDCPDGTRVYGIENYGIAHQNGNWQAGLWSSKDHPMASWCP